MIDLRKAIATTVKTGKVLFGSKNAVKNAKIGRARLIVIAANCPQKIREDIEYYCKLSNIHVFIYKGNNIDLGAVCGKPIIISALTIREPGDSDILRVTEAANV